MIEDKLIEPCLMSDDEISELLPHLDALVEWAKQVKEYALEKALNGSKFKGFKLVEGRSNRTWKSKEEAIERLISLGIDEKIIYKKELNGITVIESQLGKANFKKDLGDLVIKPNGKPTLVEESDPRKEYMQVSANDFE